MNLRFPHLCFERLTDDLQKTFDKSQIICRRKISEIPQSTSCQYQTLKSEKSLNICVHCSIFLAKIYKKSMNSRFPHFCFERLTDDLQKTFNKSQIICRRKISQIPQSTSCQYQTLKSEKSLNICVHCSNFWLKYTKSL